MSANTLKLDDKIYQYLLDHSLREHPILAKCREDTASDPMARMQIAPEQGQFLALLIKLMNAQTVVEVGTFTGYSALVMAQAMGLGGKLITLDNDEHWTNKAQQYWREAGVDEQIELKLGQAMASLDELIADERIVDLVFIDADKENQLNYYEAALKLLRPGGLVVVDNVLWSGRVADEQVQDVDTQALREFNDFVQKDGRVDMSMTVIADGLTLAFKR